MSRVLSSTTLIICLAGASLASAQPKLLQPPFGLPPGPGDSTKPPGPPEGLPDIGRLVEALSKGDSASRVGAAERIAELGMRAASAVEGLVRSLDDDDSTVRLSAIHALGMTGDRSAVESLRKQMSGAKSEFEQVMAAWALARVSDKPEEAASALPTLIAGLQSDDEAVASEAENGLIALGAQAKPAALKLLSADESRVRGSAAEILGEIHATDAVNQLVGLLGDEDDLVKVSAASALEKLGPAAADAVPSLAKQLQSDNPRLRASSLAAIGTIGTDDKDVIRAVASAMNDKSPPIAREAVRAFGTFQLESAGAIRILVQALERNPTVAAEAAAALADIGEPAVPAVAAALANEKAQYWAVLVLSEQGAAANSAVPQLATALGTATPDVQVEILLTLAKLGPDAASASADVTEQLANKEAGVQYAASYATVAIGESNRDIQAALNNNAKSKDAYLALVSHWALAKLNPGNPLLKLQALKSLVSGLASGDGGLQKTAAQAMSQLDIGAASIPQMLPQLQAAFRSPDLSVRESAVEGFALVISKNDALPLLQKAIASPPSRALAVQVAEKLGGKAAAATKALSDALSDKNPQVRRDAAMAIAAIGPAAKSAVPALTSSLTDESLEARWAATYALGAIGEGAKESVTAIQKQDNKALAFISAWAVANIAPGDAAAVEFALPILQQGLKSSDVDEQLRSAAAIGGLGSLGKSAASALQAASADPNPYVRQAAQDALSSVN